MKKILVYILFAAAVLFLFLFLIDKIPLWSSDEGRFGEKAREMWVTKDFIVPHFNYMAAIEKPVLAYLVTALSYAFFGISSWSTRLISVVSALLGVFLCYRFTRKLFNKQTAHWAALLLVTSIGYVLLGRFAMIDMFMTLLLSGTLFCLMTACVQNKRKYYLAAYVFMGLAFLTKGLIGILLPAIIFFVFLAWTRNLREIKKMHLGWGVLIVGLIILPWFIAISLQKPEFFKVFIIENHFSRFSTSVFGRKRPFWFFAPLFIALAFPWTFFMPAAIVNGLKREGEDRRKIRFLISWIAVVFIFFSIPKSKLPYYLLPLSMPTAILVASFFSDYLTRSRKVQSEDAVAKWVWSAVPLICFLAFAGLHIYLFLPFPKRGEFLVLEPILQLGSLVFALGAVLSYFFYRKGWIRQTILVFAGMIYAGLIVTIVAMKAITPFQSSFDFAELLKTRLKTEDNIAIFASPDRFSDFMFHLRKRVIVVGSDRGSLAEESKKPENAEEAKNWFLEIDDFVRLFNARQRRMVCLLKEKKLEELKNNGLVNYITLKEGGEQILISNFE